MADWRPAVSDTKGLESLKSESPLVHDQVVLPTREIPCPTQGQSGVKSYAIQERMSLEHTGIRVNTRIFVGGSKQLMWHAWQMSAGDMRCMRIKLGKIRFRGRRGFLSGCQQISCPRAASPKIVLRSPGVNMMVMFTHAAIQPVHSFVSWRFIFK